jgi:hypothetical protein
MIPARTGSLWIHVKLAISSKSEGLAQSRGDAEKSLRTSASLRENIKCDITEIRVEPKTCEVADK